MKTEKDTAKSQARAQLNSCIELLGNLNIAMDWTAEDEAREAITDNALSVDVRSGWNSPGSLVAEEYCILLCTGGPAVRITGELDQYNQPHTAEIQYQDWGTPWTRYHETTEKEDEILLNYCQTHYFGE